VATRPDGAFSVDAAGLVPPYTLKVQWYQSSGPKQLYAVSGGGADLDVNPFTDLAFSAAAGGRSAEQVFRSSDSDDRRRISDGAARLLARLQVVLAPLLERYGITDLGADRAAVRLLLEDIRIRRSDGVVTVTNRATGGVIFRGPLSDLASGTFTAANMPEGPGTTPPPAGDGAALYEGSCAGCHGPLATSQVRGESANSIAEAIADNEGGMGTPALRALTSTQLSAIASALSGSGGGGGGGTPGTCTSFTYSAWGACTAGTQTRTVLASMPAGCTGGAPALSQACGTTPPPPDGAALYAQHCAGCHGNSKKGSSAANTQRAITNNTGGMGTAALRALTTAELQAIAAAP
jgi:mono/diheme cytochrome c family protein